MAIANVIQRGQMIIVYDEKGMQIWSKPIAGTVQGYTATSVTIRQGNMLTTYDKRGNWLSARPI